MTNLGKYLIALALVLGAFGTLAFFNVTAFHNEVQQTVQKFGSDVSTNVPWYTNGFKYGNLNALYQSASLTLVNGSDQAVWQNLTGQPVIVTYSPVYLNSLNAANTASSTFSIAIGATSTAVVSEPYKLNWETASSTSDFPDLLVTNFTFATGTPAGIPTSGILFSQLVDNFTYHASSTSALNSTSIVVPPNAYLYAKLDSTCITEGGCETSTSTNRGFTTVSIPFSYNYSSPN